MAQPQLLVLLLPLAGSLRPAAAAASGAAARGLQPARRDARCSPHDWLDDHVGLTQVLHHHTAKGGGGAARDEQRQECSTSLESPAGLESLQVGTFVQVLPGVELIDLEGSEEHKPGERGRISAFHFCSNQYRVSVTWERTGETSSVAKDGWGRLLRIIGEVPALREGEWLQALPGQSMYDPDGDEIYTPNDFGVIVEVHARTPEEAKIDNTSFAMVSIEWTRTQRISTMSTKKWPKFFRYAKTNTPNAREGTRADRSLEVGALLQVRHRKIEPHCGDYCGEEFFNMSDLGRISDFANNSRILVTWQRTGKTSSFPKKYLNRFFRILAKAPVLKRGNWLQVLPNRSLVERGVTVYGPGHFGVIEDAGRPEDADGRLVVRWLRSKRKTTIRKQLWPRSFRLARA